MTYRPDIDGLRALAVLAVLVFHLGFEALEGGFVGVDIFFVISGFLITSILETRHDAKRFGFAAFYLGRVRRLLPALFVTIAGTVLAAAALMTPDDFIRFARSALAAVASVSNIIFFLEAGYWDTASDLKPLLHTWSLGVEEQFYLLWPVLLVGIFGPLRRYAGQIFLAITLLGLAASYAMTETHPSAAFFLSPFRVFEFSLGALIIYIHRLRVWQAWTAAPWRRDGLFAAGLGFCLYAIVHFDANTVFPGLNALIPCLGAALILLAGSGDRTFLIRLLLENRLTVWIGRVSYSLYLVHWPIISLYRYETGHALDLPEQAMLALATLLATLILYYGVEQRLRKPPGKTTPRQSDAKVAAAILGCGLVLGGVNLHILTHQGWLWRLPDIQLAPDVIDAGKNARFDRIRAGCRIDQLTTSKCDPSKAIQVLVIGNSHEPDGYNFFQAGYGAHPDVQLIHFGTLNRCKNMRRTETGWQTDTESCVARADGLNNAEFVESLDVIVHSSKHPFGANKQIFLDILLDVKARNRDVKIVTLGGYIYTHIECARLINEGRGSEACRAPDQVAYFADQEDTEALFEQSMALSDVYIDRVDLLCIDRRLETCLTETPDGVPLMYDQHHLSLEFADYSGRLFAASRPDFFDTLLAAHGTAQPTP